jgi:spermidine synthase
LSQSRPRRVLTVEETIEELRSLLAKASRIWFVDAETPCRIALKAGKGDPLCLTTRYQQLEVVHLDGYGLCMILDGKVQLAQSDEHVYHELLVHPACVIHGDPRRCLILGGGDGCAARELLRYPSMEEVIVVDIDEQVLELFKGQYREINSGAFNDPRVKVYCQDAMDFLERDGSSYDIIISDLTEPYDPAEIAGDLSVHVYSEKAYRTILQRLNDHGVFVCQTGGILYQPHYDRYHFRILEGIKEVFPHVATAYEFVPSFEALWSITLGARRPLHVDPSKVDETLKSLGVEGLRFYSGTAHQRVFSPARFGREV